MTIYNSWTDVDSCAAIPLTNRVSQERLTVTTANVLPPVANMPGGGLFFLAINGVVFASVDGSFSLSGQTITWTSTDYSVQPTDVVVAIYSYLGP